LFITRLGLFSLEPAVMENLEVNLSSLAVISRHVDKSHNQISQYLSKQIWSQQDRQSILECLAQLLLEKDYTLLIARHVRPLILDLLERNAERVQAGGQINHDLHERLCVALSRLLGISPDAQASTPPVFQRLFFTSEQSSAVQYGPRRMKLRELMAATLRFLQSDCAKFRRLWDWSPCVSQLLTSDVMVRGALEESQQMEAEKALVLTNKRSVMWHQEVAQKFTRGQVVSEDLSQNVVAVCGVVLPRMVPRKAGQVKPTNLVLVESTCQNLRRLALAVASHKPVLLEGPIGCGKTALVEFMAAITGHMKGADILKVQLGDQTDSKVLVHKYPMLTVVSDRLLDIYCQLTGERHSELDTNTMQTSTEQQDKPDDKITSLEGRALSMSQTSNQTFALTRPSAVLLEQLAVCVAKGEPVLLVGETGTGKTSTVQHLATITGHKLRVVNMNQQSDTADLLGGLAAVIFLPLLSGYGSSFSPLTQSYLFSHLNWAEHYFRSWTWGAPSRLAAWVVGQHFRQMMATTCALPTMGVITWYKPVDHRQILLPLREAFEELFSQTYSRKQNLTFLGHVQTCFREKRWQDLVRLMDHVCKSALAKQLQERPEAQAVKKGHWILMDEINLAAAETLECLSGLLEGSAGSLVLLDRGDTGEVKLDRSSHPLVQKLVCQHILSGNTKCLKQPIPAPPGRTCVEIEGYWVPQGEMEPALDPSYILTASVKLNLRDLARVVSAGTHPVLIQGETSVGKTSLIRWLALTTGNQCVRINNHEHTDIQEYIGCYSSDDRGKLVFKEGVLIDAMRKGYWVILDELNLAPTDVLEALNRLLDDNRELFVAETQEVIKAHPRFMLFATQNPPGLYGGRKVLSRAFRNRFVELHFDELPSGELEIILHQRCSLPPSYCTKLVKVMLDLQSLRRGSSVFAGKHGFITLRDLFRWAERYKLEEQTQASQDWLQHLADDGEAHRTCCYMLLAGRVRKQEEEAIILTTLQKHFKRTVNPDDLFSQRQLTSQFRVPEEFRHVVWTQGLRRMAMLIGRALRFGESVLLVGDTGVGEDVRLFEWNDGPLVLAMKEGGVFLMDEISLADDSVLERLNSVLETEKSLVLAEKGSGDDEDVELIRAASGFRLVATMNPGGDFGKKEVCNSVLLIEVE
ncbi:hypothetical protein GOODEAATRI_003702, partial [Goodea atripinnis]